MADSIAFRFNPWVFGRFRKVENIMIASLLMESLWTWKLEIACLRCVTKTLTAKEVLLDALDSRMSMRL